MFGDREILELRKSVKMEACHTLTIVHQFRMNKDRHKVGPELQSLKRRLEVLPISSAKCAMNLTHTSLRNMFDPTLIRDILFVKINGPPIKFFNADHYASLWIKEGRHLASDTGIAAKKLVEQNIHKLFK